MILLSLMPAIVTVEMILVFIVIIIIFTFLAINNRKIITYLKIYLFLSGRRYVVIYKDDITTLIETKDVLRKKRFLVNSHEIGGTVRPGTIILVAPKKITFKFLTENVYNHGTEAI